MCKINDILHIHITTSETNVFKIVKYIIYIAIIATIAGYFWALPKLDFIKKNPGFCTQLTHNLYYCGDKADAKQMFEASRK